MNELSHLVRSAISRPSFLAAALATAASLAIQNPAEAAGFEGYYAPANWTLTELGIAPGIVNVSSAPASITLIGSDNGSGNFSDTYYTIRAPIAGTVSFDWSYFSEDDPGYDGGFYVVSSLDNFILLSATSGESGHVSFMVTAGQLFGFNIYSEDSLFGAGELTITNFVAPAVPEPATYAMMALGLLAVGAGATRRRA